MTAPWLTLIGIGEDGLDGLSADARGALDRAEAVFGGSRHLALAGVGDRGRAWPLPFDIAPVLAMRGRPVAVLASGDPFWHGAGGSLVPHLERAEWVSHPAPSTFQWAANRLGWRMEETVCLGLHAAPFARLRAVLSGETRAICLLRDAAAPAALAEWLVRHGFGATAMTVLEALGGPSERVRGTTAEGFDLSGIAAPVAVALHTAKGTGLPRSAGLPDDVFAHDGQITKAPVRAITLAALAPRPGAHLWDLGAGSGSVSVEFVLAGGRATAVEARGDRVANIRANAESFGIAHRLSVVEGASMAALDGLAPPDAVFVGGGCDAALLARLWEVMAVGTVLVVNAVTLDTEALLLDWHGQRGGTLWRFDVAEARPLGRLRGWAAPARGAVEGHAMRVAGFGYRTGAGTDSLRAALEAALVLGGEGTIAALATATDKAEGLAPLADALGLPLHVVPLHHIAAETRATLTPRIPARYGHRSLSEAACLVAAGPAARLIVPSTASPDGHASCAIAEGPDA